VTRAQQALLDFSAGTAVFSPCPACHVDVDPVTGRCPLCGAKALYRYLLTRPLGPARPAVICGLNPSTATATVPDQTISKEIAFARSWGCGDLVKANAFGLRSTNPLGLLEVEDPVGPENDRHIREAAKRAGTVVCAWGTHSNKRLREMIRARGAAVLAILRELGVKPMCLRVNKDGSPGHPLYLPAALQPFPFEGAT
jgi:hypothetical protein